jgi:hypothetical protein
MKKLNLGCGADIRKGYVNQDFTSFKGVDDVFNFNKYPWKYKDNQFEEIRIINCVHCANNLVDFMNEVWRIAKPNAKIIIQVQYFLSTESANDPYTKIGINFNSFNIFLHSDKSYYSHNAKFNIIKRKWIFSDNKYLRWLSFFPNLLPKFYGRFLYFYFPSNKIYFELKAIK